MKAIYKREVSSYFNSMIGWIFVAVLTVFIGIYFFAYNLFQGYPYFSMALGSSPDRREYSAPALRDMARFTTWDSWVHLA